MTNQVDYRMSKLQILRRLEIGQHNSVSLKIKINQDTDHNRKGKGSLTA